MSSSVKNQSTERPFDALFGAPPKIEPQAEDMNDYRIAIDDPDIEEFWLNHDTGHEFEVTFIDSLGNQAVAIFDLSEHFDPDDSAASAKKLEDIVALAQISPDLLKAVEDAQEINGQLVGALKGIIHNLKKDGLVEKYTAGVLNDGGAAIIEKASDWRDGVEELIKSLEAKHPAQLADREDDGPSPS